MSWLAVLTLIPLFAAVARRRSFPLHLAAALGVVVLLASGDLFAAAMLWCAMLALSLIPAR